MNTLKLGPNVSVLATNWKKMNTNSIEVNQQHDDVLNLVLPEYRSHRCVPVMGTRCMVIVYVQFTVCVGMWCVLRSCYCLIVRSENNHKPQRIWKEEIVTNRGILAVYGGRD